VGIADTGSITGLGESISFGLKSFLRGFGELGEEECDDYADTEKSDSEVDPLNIVEVVLVTAREEVLGSNEGTGEGSHAVERLGELQPKGSDVERLQGRHVGVRGDLERSQATSDNGRACNESTEDCSSIGAGRGRLRDRPKQDSTQRVEGQTGDDGDLVTLAFENFTGNGRVTEVTDTEIGDLKTGGLKLGDMKDVLEVLVQYIEETVRETPQEEQRRDERECPNAVSTNEPSFERVAGLLAAGEDCTPCHCACIGLI